jgi:glyoxylase-like metal-dependent hydrolase (beta-lactamase superfamily II)
MPHDPRRDRVTLQRIEVGGFLAPEALAPGQRMVVNSWIVRHPDATVLVDTGIAATIPADDWRELRFMRVPILDALASIGVQRDEIDLVINCHLHADHAGGNVDFHGTPILVQQAELEAAHEPDYSLPDALDLDAGSYRVLDGGDKPLPGIRIVPTPGHSPGHQAVAIDTAEGRVVLAGQSFRWASDFGMALTALRLAEAGEPDPPPYPEWLPGIMALEPWRVAFAHDLAIWQRDA